MGNITVKQFEPPFGVYAQGGRGAIRQDQFLAVFDVTVDLNGCYAIIVELVEDNSETLTILSFGQATSFDRAIAANTSGGRIQTYCFKAGQARTFSITSDTPAPAGKPALQSRFEATPLPPLEGYWPQEEIGSEIEIRLEINVYLIRPTPCTGDDQCTPTPINELRDEDPRIEFVGDEVDVDIKDGIDPALRAGGELGKAVGGAILGSRTVSPTDEQRDVALAFALNETKRLRKQVRRMQSRRSLLSIASPAEGLRRE